jgi:hypothetical protein
MNDPTILTTDTVSPSPVPQPGPSEPRPVVPPNPDVPEPTIPDPLPSE